MSDARRTIHNIKQIHQPERAVVNDCDYKDRNLVCSCCGEDWPCRTRQIIADWSGLG